MKQKSNIAQVKNTHLSIQLSLDGFSFCVHNTITKELLELKTITFEQKSRNHEDLLANVLKAFTQEASLKQDFESVSVNHSNELSTFVPQALFQENKAHTYLHYSVKVFPNDYVTFDEIPTQQMVNVYIPFVNVNNYLFDKFGAFDYKHSNTILVEQLLQKSKNSNKLQFYVHFEAQQFQIVVINDNKLQFFNTFNYATKEDVLYYILFTAEQLQLNPEAFELILLGNISKNSDIYEIIYKYVRNVTFLPASFDFFTSETPDNTQQFILLHNR